MPGCWISCLRGKESKRDAHRSKNKSVMPLEDARFSPLCPIPFKLSCPPRWLGSHGNRVEAAANASMCLATRRFFKLKLDTFPSTRRKELQDSSHFHQASFWSSRNQHFKVSEFGLSFQRRHKGAAPPPGMGETSQHLNYFLSYKKTTTWRYVISPDLFRFTHHISYSLETTSSHQESPEACTQLFPTHLFHSTATSLFVSPRPDTKVATSSLILKGDTSERTGRLRNREQPTPSINVFFLNYNLIKPSGQQPKTRRKINIHILSSFINAAAGISSLLVLVLLVVYT